MKKKISGESGKRRMLKLIPLLCLLVVFGVFCSKSNEDAKVDKPAAQEPAKEEVPVAEYIVHAPPGAENWPSFRGFQASGVAGDQDIPLNWDVETGENIKWRFKTVGLGHSSPVIWKDKVFITTAKGKDDEPYLKVGSYGSSPDNKEDYDHEYIVYCLDKNTGDVIWQKTAFKGVPKVFRHVKASHANCTVSTDGKYVTAFFGSQGLYCYDMGGKLLWTKDFGLLDAGAFDYPEIQWGFGSSPLIYKDKVLVLCDVNNQSFITALDVATGKEIWRTLRDETPTWGTPTVHESKDRVQVIVNGYKHLGAYDVNTGKELWWLKGGGDIPVPTPVIAHGMVFFSSAHGRLNPITAIKLTATGDITLKKGETSNEHIVWYKPRRGSYMPTPIVYGDYFYVNRDNGIVTCYDAKTGDEFYRERIAGFRGSYTASPVAADGRIYFTEEHGNIHILQAGPTYKHLASNKMNESTLATPAISGKTLFIRTSRHLYAVAKGASTPGLKAGKEKPAASKETAAKDQPAPFVKPDGEPGKMTDPTKILELTNSATYELKTVQYDINLVGEGGAEAMVGSLKASVIASGYVEFFPERFRVNGEAVPPGAPKPVSFSGGADGNAYYFIDHDNKTAEKELDLRDLMPQVRPVLGAVIREFHVDNPFGDEVKAEKKELKGIKNIGGEDCYEIDVTYSLKEGNRSVWFLSVNDFLPRARRRFVKQGEIKGSVYFELSNLEAEPKTDPDMFKFNPPEGYKVKR